MVESFTITVTGRGCEDPLVEASGAARYLQDKTAVHVRGARDKKLV